jgi:hypothetical protein
MKIFYNSLKKVILFLLFVILSIDVYAEDSIYFRSFTPEQLADAPKAIKRKVSSTAWTFTFTNTTLQIVDGLYFESGQEVLAFTNTSPFTAASKTSPDKKKWLLNGGSVDPGSEIVISGKGNKQGMKITKWYWKLGNARVGSQNKSLLPKELKLLLPMPNISNVGGELFKDKGFLGGFKIGIPQAPGTNQLAWVKLANWQDVQKTLKDNSGYHIGNPAGFVRFTNKQPIIGLQKCLPPKKFNNKLFAEVVALKFNIVASKLDRTPSGFSELVFDEGGTNPLNGLTLQLIADKADSALTNWSTTSFSLYPVLYNAIHKINFAFKGPIDTVSFGRYTSLTGVKLLSQVSFLVLKSKILQNQNLQPNTDNYEKPDEAYLTQNYPNPFNPVTKIEFQLPMDAMVTVKVYDILGREIVKLAENQEFLLGTNVLEFNGSTLPAGVYFYSIIVHDIDTNELLFQNTRKMILNK